MGNLTKKNEKELSGLRKKRDEAKKDFKKIRIDEVIETWKKENNVPYRSQEDKKGKKKLFLLSGRIGEITTKKRESKIRRSEEHLCLAMFNHYNKYEKNKLKIKNYGQYIVDYQTPIKMLNSNSGWGKIDLVGLVSGSVRKQFVFWEMKWKGEMKWKSGDNPLAATIQLLAYAKAFDIGTENGEANLKWLLFEICAVRKFNEVEPLRKIQPTLFIGAPKDYWEKYKNDEGLKNKVVELRNKIKENAGFEIKYWNLGNIKADDIVDKGEKGHPRLDNYQKINPEEIWKINAV